MDKLEQYLDQVCRSIGGPRSLRQHVRQELREHLLDAVAQHQRGGLSEEEALDQALEEFGRPEDVRSELEATHGHRMMAVVIDKAMQWKEMTMRAKWLWTTWAYLGLVAVIALEVLFITFMVMFIVPKFQKLMHDGMIDPAIIEEQGVTWMPAFLQRPERRDGRVHDVPGARCGGRFGACSSGACKSENKTLMRLSALGTVGGGADGGGHARRGIAGGFVHAWRCRRWGGWRGRSPWNRSPPSTHRSARSSSALAETGLGRDAGACGPGVKRDHAPGPRSGTHVADIAQRAAKA